MNRVENQNEPKRPQCGGRLGSFWFSTRPTAMGGTDYKANRVWDKLRNCYSNCPIVGLHQTPLPYLSKSDHFGGILDRNPTFLKAKYDSRKILQVIERIGLFPFKNNFAEKNIYIKFRGDKFRYLSKIQSFSRFPLCQLDLFWTYFRQILLFPHISTP